MSAPANPPALPGTAATAATGDRPRSGRTADAARAAVLALVDFAAVAVVADHLVTRFQHVHADAGRNVDFELPSEVTTPLLAWVWFLVLGNGVVLCLSRRTRVAGVGLVVAAGVVAVPVATWVVWTLATFSTG